MKRPLVITLNVLSWTAILVYLLLSSRYTRERKQQRPCREVRVVVLDSAERGFITPAMVRGWFASEKIPLVGRELSSINTLELERFVRRRGYVRSARVYASIDGVLTIEIAQRKPVMRFKTDDGNNFYVTDDGYVLPQQRQFSSYVPIVTGRFELPFPRDYVGPLDSLAGSSEKKVGKNYLFLAKLINFVKFVGYDDFWNAFIVQIRVNGADPQTEDEPQVEIVPRAGDQVIALGGIDAYEQKLDKLMSFYRKAVLYEGWDRYRYVNLKYKDQIVCVK